MMNFMHYDELYSCHQVKEEREVGRARDRFQREASQLQGRLVGV
jgi:hypothetical protein